MQITRSEEYGLRGVLFLATRSPSKMALVSEISRVEKLPEPFLAKIFQRLSKAGVVRSVRGAKGGFYLGKPAKEITLREVLEAIEGPIALNRCLVRKGECKEEEYCPIHPVWEVIQDRFLEVLNETTLEDLVRRKVQIDKKGRR